MTGEQATLDDATADLSEPIAGPSARGEPNDSSDSGEPNDPSACGEPNERRGAIEPSDAVAVSEAAGALSEAERLRETEALLEEHQGLVFRYAYSLTGCRAAAEDITQDVFLRAFRHVHQLRDARASKGWLLVIARNEFSRWCRKQKPSASLDVENGPDPEATKLADVGQGLEQTEWVHRGLRQLPEDYRMIVMMFYFEELSYAEIASQLDIPMGTVMSRLSRGKKHLKQELEKLEDSLH